MQPWWSELAVDACIYELVLILILVCVPPLATVAHALCIFRFYSDPAEVVGGIKDTIGNESFSASFTCAVVGIPRPSVSWSRFNSSGHLTEIVSDSVKYVIVETEENIAQGLVRVTSELTVVNLNKTEDELFYHCEGSSNVTNLLDVVSTSEASLTVQGICYSWLISNLSNFTYFLKSCMFCTYSVWLYVCVCVL